MRKITIQKLCISNFKGISSLEINFGGSNLTVEGANGAGKTTIMDAFCWALWGKDSHGNADFDIKPIVNGESMHKAEHEVELTLKHETNITIFRRVFSEKWTKPRGQLEYTFTGHETKYYVNEEPVTLTKYKKEVSVLIDEKIFQLLSNPLYFNQKMTWQARRNVLIELCGNISPADVISDDERMQELQGITEDSEIEKKKKIAADRASKIRKEIESLPVRIAELQRMLPQGQQDVTTESLEAELAIIEQGIEENMAATADVEAKVTSGTTPEIEKLRDEVAKKAIAESEAFDKIKNELRTKCSKLSDKAWELKKTAQNIQEHYQKAMLEISELQQKRKGLLNAYREVQSKVFVEEKIETHCPTCGQPLEADKVETAQKVLDERRRQFNTDKVKKLEEITSEGKGIAEAIIETQKTLGVVENKFNETKAAYDKAKEAYITANAELTQYKPSESAELVELKAKLIAAMDKVQANKNAYINEATAGLKTALAELKKNRQGKQEQIAQLEAYKATNKRIAELQGAEQELNLQHEEQRRILYACEVYTRKRMKMLSDTLNSKFKLAKWTLFKRNITNGGIEECCEVSLNGVPYKNINSAGVINVGMDIIETLISHYQCSVPIFIDNAESVTNLNKIDGMAQIIRLFVSADSLILKFIKE